MSDSLIPFLIRFINSKAGGFIQAAIGAGLGWLVAFLATKGFHVPPELVADLTKWLVFIGMAAVGGITQYLQTIQVHKVQAALGVDVDGHIGPVTIDAAKDAAFASLPSGPTGNGLPSAVIALLLLPCALLSGCVNAYGDGTHWAYGSVGTDVTGLDISAHGLKAAEQNQTKALHDVTSAAKAAALNAAAVSATSSVLGGAVGKIK